jgi:hypothetical protein
VKQFKAFAIEWNSNGTNDLVIVNENGEVMYAVQEVLFGYRVNQVSNGDHLVLLDNELAYLNQDDYEQLGAPLVSEIDRETALRYAAVSPVSDSTEPLIALFNKYQI